MHITCSFVCFSQGIKFVILFQLSGREMFFFNPDLAAGDLMEEGDEAFDSYALQEDDWDAEVQV